MKTKLFGFLLLLLIVACNDQQEKVVDFDDLTQSSDRYKEGERHDEKPENQISAYDSLSGLSQKLVDSLGFEHSQIALLDTLFFPDRFGAKKTEKWCLITEKDSLVFMHWNFKDSLKTQNAFFNWLDCYGKNCRSIHVGDQVAFSKRATLYILQDRDLFFIESDQKLNSEEWLTFFDNQKWDKKRKFLVEQAPRKKAVWKQRDSKGTVSDLKVLNSGF